jgi:hypothetical protein
MEHMLPSDEQPEILLTYGARTIIAERPNDYASARTLADDEFGLSGFARITLLVKWKGRMAEVQPHTFHLVAAKTDQIFVKQELPVALQVFLACTAVTVSVVLAVWLGPRVSIRKATRKVVPI